MKTIVILLAVLVDVCTSAVTPPIVGAHTPTAEVHLDVRQDVTHEGTSHYSTKLTLSAAGHKSLSFVANEAADVMPPIIVGQIAIDPRHVLVVGWSSTGGGMQTVDAILVAVDDEALVVTDRLTYTAARGDAFVATTRKTAALKVGIPIPNGVKPIELVDPVGREAIMTNLHEPGDWRLSWGKLALGVSDLLALPFRTVPPDAQTFPRVGPRDMPGFAVWFDVDARGFHRIDSAAALVHP